MELRKDMWSMLRLFECCEFHRGVVFSTKDEVNTGGIPILRSHNVDFETYKISLHNLKYISKNVKIKPSQRLMKNDILISVANSKEQTGKVGFSYSDTDTYAGGFMGIIRPLNGIEPYYLFNYLISPKGKEFLAGKTQGTTNIYNITFDRIKDLQIPLPPTEEQKKIASLFQSIETAIEQVEIQERNIQSLQKKLINGLLERDPQFGILLREKNTSKIKFGEIADCIETHDKERMGITRFVGLENIESGNFKIETWGNVSEGTTFTKRFDIGDILFGKRRPYLKKVAVADFEGICSGDILVLRARKEIVLPDLLPYYVASEAFIQHAITTSAGSLSPRTKWKDLRDFEFSLPDINFQVMITGVFNQVQILLTQFKEQKAALKSLKNNLLNEILG